MDERNEEHIDNPQPVSGNGRGSPPYEFYQKGLNQANWISTIVAFMQHRTGGEVVAVVTILVLYLIASLFAEEKGKGCDSKTLAFYLAIATMVFIVGLVATLRATKGNNVEDTQKNQRETNKPDLGNGCSQQNGSAPRRDGRT